MKWHIFLSSIYKGWIALGIFIISAADVSAQDVIARHAEHASASTRFMGMLYQNPSYQMDRYKTSLNRASLYNHNRQATLPPLLEDGDDTQLWGARVNAYISKGKSAIWGYAHYDNSRTKNIHYSETSDASLLYPYVMADTIGGGTSKDELYDFMGGFSTRLNPKWIIGAQGAYTAQLDYRVRDPRPKNLTSDIKLTAGTSYFLSAYQVGVAVHFHRYKQTNEVKVYNETSSPLFYHLTGLGTDYYRFRGENTATYYKGAGWGITLNAAPKDRSGFFASYQYQNLYIDKIISSLNELPMSTLKLYYFSAEAGYLNRGRRHDFGVKFNGNHSLRKGIENIFGSPASHMYPQIGSEPQFKQQQLNLSSEALYRCHSERSVYEFDYRFSYNRLKETHNDPYRLMQSSAISSRIQAKGLWLIHKWLCQIRLSFLTVNSLKNNMELMGELNRAMLPPLLQRYDYLSSHRYLTDNNIEFHYDTGRKYSVFFSLNWQYCHYQQHQHTNEQTLSIGIEF